MTYLGKIAYVRNEWRSAIQILTTNIEQIRVHFPDSEALADALNLLATLFFHINKVEERNLLLVESLRLYSQFSPEKYLCTLHTLAFTINHTQLTELTSVIASACDEFMSAHPYVAGELLTVLGDALFDTRKVCYYLKALALYKCVQPTSWYVARLLVKILNGLQQLQQSIFFAEKS